MKKIIFLLAGIVFLTGCANNAERTQAFLDRLEFGDDETGCIRVQSDLKLGGNPFLGSDTNVAYHKRKAAEGEQAPQC